eukprot:gene2468-2808_t
MSYSIYTPILNNLLNNKGCQSQHQGCGTRPASSSSQQQSKWSPLADIQETDKEFVVFVELPGVKKDDVSINITQGVLTISGEKKLPTFGSTSSSLLVGQESPSEDKPCIEDDDEDTKPHKSDFTFGRFNKEFKLPQLVDLQSISATHVDGVLTITIPKIEPEVIKNYWDQIPTSVNK